MSGDGRHDATPVGGSGAEARPPVGQRARCVCDRCGAHVLAIALGGEHYDAVCGVCGSEEVTPLR